MENHSHENLQKRLFEDKAEYDRRSKKIGLQSFVETIQKRKPSLYSFKEGLENIRLCLALQKSAEEKRLL